MRTGLIIASIILIMISAIGMGIYVVNKHKTTLFKKHQLSDNKKLIILTLIMLIGALGVFFYSLYSKNAYVLRAFVDGEMMLWIISLGYIDLVERIIPNKIVLAGIIFWVIISAMQIFIGGSSWKVVMGYSMMGALICGGVLLIIAIITKSALGMGDVKMFTVLGLIYGVFDTYSILLFTVIVMAIVSIVLLALKKVNRKTAIPMAPFVIFGFLINILAGM